MGWILFINRNNKAVIESNCCCISPSRNTLLHRFQTGLPVLLSVVTKCQRTLNESIRNTVFSSVKANVQLINAAVLPLLRMQCQCKPNAER